MGKLIQRSQPYFIPALFFSLIFFPACEKKEPKNESMKPGNYARSLAVDGRTRTYRLHIPPGYSGKTALPLVIALHGGGGTGAEMETLTGFSQLSDRENFIVAYPDGFLDNRWADGRGTTAPDLAGINDVTFISSLIDEIGRLVMMESRRVYVCGFSNGSMFVNFLACELSARIAAIGGVSGQLAENKKALSPAAPLGVIYLHGTADPAVPYGGGTVVGPNAGEVLSTAELMAFWVGVDGASPAPVTEILPDTDPADGTRVIRFSFLAGRNGTQVHLYRIENGGHTWPGSSSPGSVCRDINATELIWGFFQTQSK